MQDEEKRMAQEWPPQPEGDIVDPDDGDDELAQSIRYAIASYGADMPVDGLVGRLERGDIFVPEFQRKLVWTVAQASRFIESLLLGLPVPGIFLFKEPDTRKLMVVDGQQRLLSLQSFYKGVFREKAFELTGVAEEFDGRTHESLAPADQRNLSDSIVHATVFEQIEPGNDRSSVYSIFERLNTGGTPLSPQEIRSCIYRGALNDLLMELAANRHWRNMYGRSSVRKKDEEIILRFLALRFRQEKYERPMKRFLNDFMDEYREPSGDRIREFRETFERTIEAADTILGPQALRPEHVLNVSVADAVLVGLSYRVCKGSISDVESLKSAHRRLLERMRGEALYARTTTDSERVRKRIAYARQAYEDVR